MSDSPPADNPIRARTDAQAKARFKDALNLALSAVHAGQWLIQPTGDGRWVAVTTPGSLDLRTNDGSVLYLRSTLTFDYEDDTRPGVAGGRKVSTQDYAHTVSPKENLKPQIYSWEWAAASSHYPHLHLHRSNPDAGGLGKLHIPTGRVFFEDVLLFLIHEHGVVMRRDDGLDTLTERKRLTARWASWGGGAAPR